jgi:Ni/Co efflux regulator RcnB
MWSRSALMLLLASLFIATPALAEGGKHDKHHERGDDRRDDREEHGRRGDRDEHGRHFDHQHVVVVHEYYGEQFRRGRCPPGLMKKHDGCMPPGQAKRWEMGRPLPREVVYYEVPPALVVKLPQPHAGQRYVRVATDILLISVGSGMVIDAINDLGRR